MTSATLARVGSTDFDLTRVALLIASRDNPWRSFRHEMPEKGVLIWMYDPAAELPTEPIRTPGGIEIFTAARSLWAPVEPPPLGTP